MWQEQQALVGSSGEGLQLGTRAVGGAEKTVEIVVTVEEGCPPVSLITDVGLPSRP